MRIARQENHSDAIIAGSREIKTQFLALRFQELMGNLQKDARPIARVGFATFRAAVLQIDEDLK